MLKHNSFFDGQVQSIGFERNGRRTTIGVVAGDCHFETAAPERMTVSSGLLRVNVGGAGWALFPAGTYFEVPAKTAFDMQPVGGPAAYVCEFL
jgi:uncharacterized protein YaiE (UPF0345 family)